MKKKVFDYIQKHHMIERGDTVLIGVSGGADSVCLLLLLAELREKLGIRLQAVHINHHLRVEAAADEAYVEKLCRKLSVPFQAVDVQVEEYAAAQRIGCEEAGRELRYQAFREIAASVPAQAGHSVKIAVAHHQDDQAETVLFHLFRGTGLSGLAGIRPVRGEIIRPLLCLTRAQIEEWLNKENISYCMDWTNLEDTYTRNKIRHHILPYAEEEINSRAAAHIAKTAEICGETEDYIKQQTEKLYDKCVTKDKNRCRISVPAFLAQHPLLQKRLLLHVFEELLLQRRDVEAVHVEAVLFLFSETGSKELNLPKGLIARKEYDTVVIETPGKDPESGGGSLTEKAGAACTPEEGCPLIIPEGQLTGSLLLPDGREIVWELITSLKIEENLKNIPEKSYTKWFDYDKIKRPMAVRSRRTGDYLTIHITEENRFARKPLKKYFITEKVPRRERDSILLLTEGAHVLWVTGYRISEYYKVTAETERILQVQLRGEHTDG